MTKDNSCHLQSILKDRKIQEKPIQEFAGIQYQTWTVEPNLWADQIETLLENGFMVSIHGLVVTINKQLPSSPQQLKANKDFWRELKKVLTVD